MTNRQADRMAKVLLWTYVGGALLTNAYMREFRWEDWASGSRLEPNAIFRTIFGTLAWPVYWAAKGASEVVTWLADIRITIN